MAAKADVNAAASAWEGRTALQAAAEGDHLNVVDRLLARKGTKSRGEVKSMVAWAAVNLVPEIFCPRCTFLRIRLVVSLSI